MGHVESVARLDENKLAVVSFKMNSVGTNSIGTNSVGTNSVGMRSFDAKYDLVQRLRGVLESVLSPLDSDYHVHFGHEDQPGHYDISILLSASEEELHALDALIDQGTFDDLGPVEGYCVSPQEYDYTGKLVVAKPTLDEFKRRDTYYYG